MPTLICVTKETEEMTVKDLSGKFTSNCNPDDDSGPGTSDDTCWPD